MGQNKTYPFVVGQEYKRKDIYSVINIPLDTKGGNWDTGYNQYGKDWFIFCNIGTAGRTGHNYNNRFIGSDLLWYGKTGSKDSHPTIQSMLLPAGNIYMFYRETDRAPFKYAGLARIKNLKHGSTPVEILWSFDTCQTRDEVLAEEEDENLSYIEGAVKRITVNAYERDASARLKCIDRYEARCFICQFDFYKTYGKLGKDYIHVHHLLPLSEIGAEYKVDPIKDLRPVCPNCHAMLHRSRPALSMDELNAILNQNKK